MSLIGYFLAKEDQNPTNIKYLHSLLAVPVSRLYSEQEALLERSMVLDMQISAQSVSESKEFIMALGNTKQMLKLESGLLSSLQACKEETEKFIGQIGIQTQIIENIVKDQQKLESLSSLQGTITEILEIPQLLKNLINARHYKDALELLEFIEKIEIKQEVFRDIIANGEAMKKRLEEDLTDMLADCADKEKSKETFNYLASLKKIDEKNEAKAYLHCKMLGFQRLVKKHSSPKGSLLPLLNTLFEYLKKSQSIYSDLFTSEDALTSFYIEVAFEILNLFKVTLTTSTSDLYEISQKVLEITTTLLIPCGCNIWPEVFEIILTTLEKNIIFYSHKTITNFENLITLYGWESSGVKENPILEFGSMSVLYNNILALVNEIR